MSITTNKTEIEFKSGNKVYYDLVRNNAEIGTAFVNEDGTINFESDSFNCAKSFPTLDKCIAWAAKKPITFIEKMKLAGI